MASLSIEVAEFQRLKGLEKEYKITVALLAVVVEQLLMRTDGKQVRISDKALTNPPEYRAWREELTHEVVFEVRR